MFRVVSKHASRANFFEELMHLYRSSSFWYWCRLYVFITTLTKTFLLYRERRLLDKNIHPMMFYFWTFLVPMHTTSIPLWPFILSRAKSSRFLSSRTRCVTEQNNGCEEDYSLPHLPTHPKNHTGIRQDVKIEQGVVRAWHFPLSFLSDVTLFYSYPLRRFRSSKNPTKQKN